MRIHTYKLLLLFCLTFIQMSTFSVVYANDNIFEVGIFPRRNIKITHSLHQPLINHLSELIGRPVKLTVSKDFKTFWKNLTERKFDLVHFNQYHYILAHKNYDYEAILRTVEFSSPTASSIIVVKKDSGFNKLSDLRGKRIMFGGGKKAMMSYIMPHWLLQNDGLNNGDYVEIIAKNPPNAIIATYKGAADAAGLSSAGLKLKLVKKAIDTNNIKILAQSEPIPFLPWAVRKEIDPELKQKLTQSLASLHQTKKGKEILSKARIDRFDIAVDSDYDSSRKIIRDVYKNNQRNQ